MAEQTPVVGRAITTERATAPTKPVEQPDDMIKVVQRRPYLGAEDKREMSDEPYEVTRQRASELVARGLADYADSGDHDKQVEADAQVAADAVRTRRAREK